MRLYALMIAVAALAGCASQAQTQTYQGEGFSVVAVPTETGTACAVVEHGPHNADSVASMVSDAAFRESQLDDMRAAHPELRECAWSS